MENGSFFRCKQMQMALIPPPVMLKKVGIDRARIYVQAQTLFTIIKNTQV